MSLLMDSVNKKHTITDKCKNSVLVAALGNSGLRAMT